MNGWDIDVSALRSFVVLAIVRSYTTAAHELTISPSGLTKRIQALERRLGTPLLIRDHGGVGGLTPAGRTLMRGAAELLSAFDSIYRSFRRTVGPGLRIAIQGIDRLVGERRQMMAAGLALRAIHPGTSIEFSLLGYEEPVEVLRGGRADLVLTALPLPHGDLVSTRLWPMRRVGVVSARHPLARWGEVDAEEFAAHTMLHVPTISAEFMSLWSLGDTRPLAGAKLVEIEPRNFRDVYESIVSTGGALAVHPEAARNRPRDLRVRAVALRNAPHTWYHMAKRREVQDPRTETFLRLLRVATHAGGAERPSAGAAVWTTHPATT
ncbi:LysR substrate-binding domain-containing protein [Actinoplanes sp. NPDC049265]|uniref:LysR substrate-binding domain-containing protein n=1 Tax=Actinoplanes sp. NPDC049265 TaxID=3363902 RepID=UPI0037145A35